MGDSLSYLDNLLSKINVCFCGSFSKFKGTICTVTC